MLILKRNLTIKTRFIDYVQFFETRGKNIVFFPVGKINFCFRNFNTFRNYDNHNCQNITYIYYLVITRLDYCK